MLEARRLWDAVERGGADYQTDRMAIENILRAVLSEMMRSLHAKGTASKAMHIGVE
uniref:Uncharacterized protein n=1 Tax=Arundo donax TaxID=35708 RepID=A0A0A8Z4K5_ARUDO